MPGADGVPNPDTKERVTVTLTNPLEIPPLDEFGLGPGHSLDNYAAGARDVTASRDPLAAGLHRRARRGGRYRRRRHGHAFLAQAGRAAGAPGSSHGARAAPGPGRNTAHRQPAGPSA